MKVFISWSGNRSKGLAKALHEWLPLVLHYVDPWLSDSDIGAGERWSASVARELGETHFGILCLTPENLDSAWILFEAGALAKSLETSRVIPILLDVEYSQLEGPLAQFQAKKASRVGIVETLNSMQKNASTPIPSERFEVLVEQLWGGLEESLAAIPDPPKTEPRLRSESDVLEDLVERVRALDVRLSSNEESKVMELLWRTIGVQVAEIHKKVGASSTPQYDPDEEPF